MQTEFKSIASTSIRISIIKDQQELAHAYLFLITNDLHDKPYALLEDVFVKEQFRSQGLGKQLVNAAIQKAKEINCYKIIGTSRNERTKIHKFYESLNFKKHGFEFRMNL